MLSGILIEYAPILGDVGLCAKNAFVVTGPPAVADQFESTEKSEIIRLFLCQIGRAHV